MVVAFALEDSIDPTDLLPGGRRIAAPLRTGSKRARDRLPRLESRSVGARRLDVTTGWLGEAWIPECSDRMDTGWIVMAGSDVAPVHGGWIAGAVTSGRAAALAVSCFTG